MGKGMGGGGLFTDLLMKWNQCYYIGEKNYLFEAIFSLSPNCLVMIDFHGSTDRLAY